jgi:DNA helicase II / ATP-dependent DNA helicase PcrA
VIGPSKERVPKELWTEAPAGDPVRVRAVMDEREEADHVLRGIQAELGRGTTADSIAIFYRVHAQSRTLEEALRRGNVPYQIIGGMKFFERAEVKDLLGYLRLSVNPSSDMDLARVINTPARGIGDKTVEHLLNVASESSVCAFDAIPQAQRELGTGASKKLGAFKTLIEGMQLEATRLSPSELAGHILEVTGYRELLRKEDSAESDARLGNLEELVGSIQDYEEEASERDETPSLSGYLERVSLVAAIDSQKSGPMVSLMTVHSAKGLEFDAVFLTGMEQEMFPYRGIASGEDEELEEERRLAYVAITRARRRLTITYAGSRTLFGQTRYLDRSQFLDDLPEDAIKLEGSARTARTSSWFGCRQPLWCRLRWRLFTGWLPQPQRRQLRGSALHRQRNCGRRQGWGAVGARLAGRGARRVQPRRWRRRRPTCSSGQPCPPRAFRRRGGSQRRRWSQAQRRRDFPGCR